MRVFIGWNVMFIRMMYALYQYSVYNFFSFTFFINQFFMYQFIRLNRIIPLNHSFHIFLHSILRYVLLLAIRNMSELVLYIENVCVHET